MGQNKIDTLQSVTVPDDTSSWNSTSFATTPNFTTTITPSTILRITLPYIQIQMMSDDLCKLRDELEKLRYEMRERFDMLTSTVQDKKGDDERIIELKEIPVSEAKPLVLEYIKKHPGSWTSDMAMDLKIDVTVVIKALEALKSECKVK